eukprot:6483608-Amphidinium_carterae.2
MSTLNTEDGMPALGDNVQPKMSVNLPNRKNSKNNIHPIKTSRGVDTHILMARSSMADLVKLLSIHEQSMRTREKDAEKSQMMSYFRTSMLMVWTERNSSICQ